MPFSRLVRLPLRLALLAWSTVRDAIAAYNRSVAQQAAVSEVHLYANEYDPILTPVLVDDAVEGELLRIDGPTFSFFRKKIGEACLFRIVRLSADCAEIRPGDAFYHDCCELWSRLQSPGMYRHLRSS
jgi:hypothetical protein